MCVEFTDSFFEKVFCFLSDDGNVDVSYTLIICSSNEFAVYGRNDEFVSSYLFFDDFFFSAFVDPFYSKIYLGSFWTSNLSNRFVYI